MTELNVLYVPPRKPALQIIGESCDKAEAQGIQLDRGAMFDWTGPDKNVPVRCTALGAVLWAFDLATSAQAWTHLKTILKVDDAWLYRFSIGWDNRVGLLIVDHEFKVLGKDTVSHAALSMTKARVRKTPQEIGL